MTSYRFVLTSWIVIGTILGSCTTSGQPTLAGNSTLESSGGRIELGLDFEKVSYLYNEQIVALLTIKNVGENEVVINKRMAPNEETAAERLRDIVFSIRGPAGEFLIPKILINVRAPGDSDFVSLSPGESVEKEIVLDKIYAFAQPGAYSVQAIYLNISDPSYARAWKGQLSSDLVTIRLED
ncbi:MAG: hypothetical protein ACC700_17845 [Anaerolineales bacterium]